MNTPLLHLLRAASVSAAFVPLAQAQILSNGTGGGDFATGSTWALGNVPTGSFRVQANDTVIANSGVNYSSTGSNSDVLGTLNVNTGASIIMGRLNNTQTINNSTINIAGGTLSVSRISPSSSSGSNSINVSAGSFIFRDTNAGTTGTHYAFNVSGTGLIRTGSGINAPLSINGGTVIFEASAKKTSGIITWTGGTVVISSGAAYNASESNTVFDSWKANAANVLAFSSQATKQTITFGTTNFPTQSASQGVMSFNVYSSSANDNDLLNFAGTSSLSLSSGVDIRLNGLSLGGAANDYLGQSYKLFEMETGVYSNLNATIAATTWTIGGEDYEIGWTNNLATNGTLTIASITAIPEPSAFAALGGLAALAFASSRRRSRR